MNEERAKNIVKRHGIVTSIKAELEEIEKCIKSLENSTTPFAFKIMVVNPSSTVPNFEFPKFTNTDTAKQFMFFNNKELVLNMIYYPIRWYLIAELEKEMKALDEI